MLIKHKILILSSFLVLATFLTFFPSLKNGFVNCDDNVLITDNPYIRSFSRSNLENIFTKPNFGLYHPLVQLTYAAEYRFAGLRPSVYHLDNILLHCANTILAFLIIFMLSGNAYVSFVSAIFFSLHPMRVESVAWATERKDVLYALFFLGSILSYLFYFRSGKSKFYLLSLGLFTLSLLSKIMAVSLPVVLIIFDYLMERKGFKKLILEKVPYFILSAVFGLIALSIHYRPHQAQAMSSWAANVKFALFGLVFYVYKLIVPLRLSFGYHYTAESFAGWGLASFVPIAVVVFAAAVLIYSLKYTKRITFGILFYAAAIFPVIQLIPVGQNALGDRYTYVPFLGLFYILALGFDRLRQKFRNISNVLLVLILLALCFLTFQKINVWKDSFNLWNDVLGEYPASAKAHKGLGDAYKEKGDLGKALAEYGKAVKERPTYADVYNNRGNLYSMMTNYRAAEKDFTRAIELDPYNAGYYYDRAIIFSNLYELNKSLADYSKTIILNPDFAQAYNNRGVIYAKLGQYTPAVRDFKEALEKNPDLEEASKNLSTANTYLKKKS